MSGVETPRKHPPVSNSNSTECPIVPFVAEESRRNVMDLDIQQSEMIWSDINSAQDGGGMMKIVPSDIDVSSP